MTYTTVPSSLYTDISSSPMHLLKDPVLEPFGVQLYLKRDDLLHPEVNGNKWRKLKYNLEEAKKQHQEILLTFGGAYSNHIHATAAAGQLFGFRTIGIIRGEKTLPLNPTLKFAQDCGMQLHYISRTAYSNKYQWEFLESLRDKFGTFYLLPEGGTNALAVKGCAEIAQEIEEAYDYICCACGSGGTLAGLAASVSLPAKVLGFAALKGGSFLTGDVNQVLKAYVNSFGRPEDPRMNHYQIIANYHCGGYAKTTPELIQFIKDFERRNSVPLDQVYTGKMMFGLYDMIQNGYFKAGETIVALHTGGLQGRCPELGEFA